MNKQLDMVTLNAILSSNKLREVKLREISQLQNGNKKIGTLQAKQIFENYQRQQGRMGNLEQLIQTLDPDTKKMFQDIQNNMEPNQFQQFLSTIHNKLKDPEELTRFLSSQFGKEVQEVQEETKILKENRAGPSSQSLPDKINEEIMLDKLNEPVAEEMIMDIDGNVLDEATDIKESDLPTLTKDEFNFLSSMMKKK